MARTSTPSQNGYWTKMGKQLPRNVANPIISIPSLIRHLRNLPLRKQIPPFESCVHCRFGSVPFISGQNAPRSARRGHVLLLRVILLRYYADEFILYPPSGSPKRITKRLTINGRTSPAIISKATGTYTFGAIKVDKRFQTLSCYFTEITLSVISSII